jgi:WD40 repeat protein
VKKGTEYLCAVQSVDGENAYAVGFDAVTKTSVLREFDMTHQLVREIDTEVLLTQIAMPRSAKTGALFAASAGGSVRAYRFPLTGEFQTLDCHGASISQIVLSHDDSTLFVASNDGCVSVFDVKDKDGASLRGRGKDAFSEEVLVTKADMEGTCCVSQIRHTLFAHTRTRRDGYYLCRLSARSYSHTLRKTDTFFAWYQRRFPKPARLRCMSRSLRLKTNRS